jgi:Zn-dependent protease with chaperone function
VSVPAETYRLDEISPRAFQHPADRAATAALQQIPYLDAVLRRLIQLGYERALRQVSLGSAVRLGDRQLPRIWALHREVFDVLDIAEVPDLYMTAFPLANAAVIGAGKPIVVVNSELVRILDDDRMRAVLAHEAAHVLADHVLYRTAALILGRILDSGLPGPAGLPLRAIGAAMLEWERAAELSSDRAAALVTRSPMTVCGAMMALAAGEAADELDLDAFVAQAIEYREKGSGIDRLSRIFLQLGLDHPLPVRRVHELLQWVREGDYDRIVGGDYLRRGEEYTLREEADVAGAHYGERVRNVFRDAGDSVADIGKQLGDWLARNRDERDSPDDRDE